MRFAPAPMSCGAVELGPVDRSSESGWIRSCTSEAVVGRWPDELVLSGVIARSRLILCGGLRRIKRSLPLVGGFPCCRLPVRLIAWIAKQCARERRFAAAGAWRLQRSRS